MAPGVDVYGALAQDSLLAAVSVQTAVEEEFLELLLHWIWWLLLPQLQRPRFP